MERIGFYLYLVFVASWFLHLTSRLPVLGEVRFDLALAAAIFGSFLLFTDKQKIRGVQNPVYRVMLVLIVVILVITPFAEWPGSAIRTGLERFIKAIAFFFFTVWFVRTERRLKLFIIVFLSCQTFRVIEPLYLHLTEGYWGEKAFMAGWEYMKRLAGAPHDTIGANGLAFVVLTILPFFLNLYRENLFCKVIAFTIVPTSLYTLYLTGSRSGMLGLGMVFLAFLMQSKHKIALLIAMTAVGGFVLYNMSGVFKDRYASIISKDTANTATAQGRIAGIWDDFRVGLRNPIFGHGLGTSLEANANFGTSGQLSHNIYTETFQEIGIVGLCVFLSLIYLIFKNFIAEKRDNNYIIAIKRALFIFASMNIFFGLASYGLSSYEWYFIAGLSVIVCEKSERR